MFILHVQCTPDIAATIIVGIKMKWVFLLIPIREIPDHATFREKENTLGRLDKLGGFISLALCN